MMVPERTETCWSGSYKFNWFNNVRILHNWVYYMDNKAFDKLLKLSSWQEWKFQENEDVGK